MHANNNIMRSISSLVECAQKIEQGYQPEERDARRVITLSATTGAGGAEVAEILAKRLGVTLYDREILELTARQAHLDLSTIERLDERLDGLKGAWLYSILASENLSKENYLRNLINVIRGIACRGGVIIGRGGSFILADLPVLRVHVVGALDRCIDRLAAQEGITRKAATRKVKEANSARQDYIKKLFKCNNDQSNHFDLIVNSDHLEPARIANLILMARESAKFE